MSVGFAYGATAPPPIKLPCTTNCGPNSHPSNECVVDSDCPHSDPCLVGNCHSGHCHHVPLCYDYNDCTVDTCDAGNCTFTLDDTLSCDDGVACTVNDGCSNGNCAGTPTDSLCDDGVLCTNEFCSASTGCSNPPVQCDDGNFCTAGDFCDPIFFCEPGQRTPCAGSTPVCDEFNDRCVECLSQSDCAGNEVEDQCDEALGVCVECLTVEQCDDFIACTDEVCHNGTCTSHVDICAGQDGQFCNGVETCDMVVGAGTCLPGTDPCPGQNCNETTNTCEGCLVDADCPAVECTAGTCCIDPNGCCIDPADPTTCGAVNECIYDVDPDGDGVLNCQDQCCNAVGCPTNSVRPGCPCNPGDGCCDPADPEKLCCDANDPNSWCPCNP